MLSSIMLAFLQCGVPEKIHTNPMEGHRKFLGGEGSLKLNFLGAMHENKLEFPGGRGGGGGGAKQKTFRGGSMDIFWNYTIILTPPPVTVLAL